ncbi:hypothetical protein INR49_025737 [Caranx melampygus]|nr:hypothetical protein INR49_025737 [Caranx melampygus]
MPSHAKKHTSAAAASPVSTNFTAAEMTHVTNHGRLLLQRLHQQREMDFLCDITIMVRDVEFRAHRNILAAFSKYFSSQAEKVQDVTTLDPDKVSRYALEKLLEFIYTGQMNLSSTRQAAVRRAAVFLGMSEATKYLEEIPTGLSRAKLPSQKQTKKPSLSAQSSLSSQSSLRFPCLCLHGWGLEGGGEGWK